MTTAAELMAVEKLDDFDYKVALQQQMVAAAAAQSTVLRPLQIEPSDVKPTTSEPSGGSTSAMAVASSSSKQPLQIGPVAPPSIGDRSTSSETTEGNRRLHVSNIPFKYREPDLQTMFEKYGTVVDVEIIFNERGSKGFGFVTMQNPEDADRARNEIHGSIIEGRRVEVNMATQRVHTKKAKPLMPAIAVDPISAAQNLLVAQQQQQNLQRALLQQQLAAQQLLVPRHPQQLIMPPTSAAAAINLQALQLQQLLLAQQQQQHQQLQQNPQLLLQLQQQQAAAMAQQQVPTSMAAHHQMLQHQLGMDPLAQAQAQMAMYAMEQQRLQLAQAVQGRALPASARGAPPASSASSHPPPPLPPTGSIGDPYLQQSLSNAAVSSLHAAAAAAASQQHHHPHHQHLHQQASAAAAAALRRYAPY
ncbi:unnamed protein product [Caenorhabditis nigoni]